MFGKLFKSNKVQGAENYIKATSGVSRPIAIIMAIVSIIIIGALLFSVFLGGRWAYNKIKGDDSTATTTSEQAASTDSEANENNSTEAPATSSSDQTSTSSTTPVASTTPTATTSSIPNTGPDESQP